MKLKDYARIQVNHHKEVPKTIADVQKQGWRLHTLKQLSVAQMSSTTYYLKRANSENCPLMPSLKT